jgi:PAS domain S-box-containing protein
VQDASRTKEQLIQELTALRQRVAELEAAETERKRAESQREAALEALRESEAKLRHLIERSADAIVLADEQGSIVEWNQSAERLTGLARAEVLGHFLWDVQFRLVPPRRQTPAFYEEHKEYILRMFRAGYAPEAVGQLREAEICRADGTHRFVETRGFSVQTERGFMAGTVLHDVTERRRAEDTLRENEERLELALEGSQQGFWDWNIATGEVQRNERWAEMLGYAPQEIAATIDQWENLVHPDDRAAVWESLNDHLAGRTPVHEIEYRMLSKGGRYRWVLERARVVRRDPEGRPVRMSGTHIDVTRRRQAAEETSRQAETLAALHETALDLAAQSSLPDLLRAIVVRAVKLLKAKEGGLLLYRPATDDLERVLAHNFVPDTEDIIRRRGEGLVGKVLDSGRPLVVDDYNRWEGRLEGRPKTFSIVGMPIFWGDRPLGVLDIVDDVPRTFSAADVALLERFAPLAAAALENNRLVYGLQQQMEELKATQAKLVHAAKLAAVGELAAGVAHELNNPLTSVLGFAELLAHNPTADDAIRHDIEIIAREARRARDIVRNLLDFGRQNKPQRLPADVNQILRQTLDLIRQHIEKSGVVIAEDYAPDLGLLTLDIGQMRQVFLNLITNATHAMPKGGSLSLRTARVGDEVAVSVSDTGVGIPPDLLDHIFEPFFTTKEVGQGTGLGLSITLGIVQEHGGRITVKSQVGGGALGSGPGPAQSSGPGGSTFTVWLPAEK